MPYPAPPPYFPCSMCNRSKNDDDPPPPCETCAVITTSLTFKIINLLIEGHPEGQPPKPHWNLLQPPQDFSWFVVHYVDKK